MFRSTNLNNRFGVKKVFVCVDFSKFDMHVGFPNIGIGKIQLYNKQVPYADEHCDREQYAYSLYIRKTGKKVIQRADKLMTGDYLTSVMGLFFQHSRFSELMRRYPGEIEPLVMIGDDFAGIMNQDF